MQRTRRTDAYPYTWEGPVAAAVGVAFLLLLGLHAGRSLANLLAGNGWVMPDREGLIVSLPGVLSGHAGSGLTGLSTPASTSLLWTCIVLVELLVLVLVGVGAKTILDRWGPGRIKGMATRDEAEQLLGLSRLRANAKIVRPDLYGPKRGTSR